jgi:hypothetical protein
MVFKDGLVAAQESGPIKGDSDGFPEGIPKFAGLLLKSRVRSSAFQGVALAASSPLAHVGRLSRLVRGVEFWFGLSVQGRLP